MMFTVYKHNHQGEETLAYTGEVIARDETYVCVRAIFQAKTQDLGYIVLKQGDIFTEWFFRDCWYNVFKIVDVDTNHLKGYYCNLTRPPQITDDAVRADDLELDVFVYPSGEILVLDEEEYNDLNLDQDEQKQVSLAVAEIKHLAREHQSPFHDLRK